MAKIIQQFKATKKLSAADTEHFIMASTVAISATEFTKVARLTVGAQQLVTPGSGRIVGGIDDRGVLVFNPKTTAPAVITGEVRLFLNNANGSNPKFLGTFRSEDLVTGATGTNNRIPYSGINVGEDSYIEVQMKADTAATATLADSTLLFPTVVKHLSK